MRIYLYKRKRVLYFILIYCPLTFTYSSFYFDVLTTATMKTNLTNKNDDDDINNVEW